MNTINQMKNIIVLKDLPSNIIEEAFVILKDNIKIKVLGDQEKEVKNSNNNVEEEPEKYIIREAEMVINNYLSNPEKEYRIKNNRVKEIENKYKRLKKITMVLTAIMIINTIIGLVFR